MAPSDTLISAVGVFTHTVEPPPFYPNRCPSLRRHPLITPHPPRFLAVAGRLSGRCGGGSSGAAGTAAAAPEPKYLIPQSPQLPAPSQPLLLDSSAAPRGLPSLPSTPKTLALVASGLVRRFRLNFSEGAALRAGIFGLHTPPPLWNYGEKGGNKPIGPSVRFYFTSVR